MQLSERRLQIEQLRVLTFKWSILLQKETQWFVSIDRTYPIKYQMDKMDKKQDRWESESANWIILPGAFPINVMQKVPQFLTKITSNLTNDNLDVQVEWLGLVVTFRTLNRKTKEAYMYLSSCNGNLRKHEINGARRHMNSKHCSRIIYTYLHRKVWCDQLGWNISAIWTLTSIKVRHWQALH